MLSACHQKNLVSEAKAASEADQFKHRVKVVGHTEVLIKVLNGLPRHGEHHCHSTAAIPARVGILFLRPGKAEISSVRAVMFVNSS